jgi:sphingomyelin phosphodiesterase
MLEFVRDEVNPDLFFWTGDNSAHNVWDNTNDEVTAYVVNVTETIKQEFAGTNITVFPIQGNHDTWPVNVQDFSKAGINVPINDFKSSWTDWLDDDALKEFGKYGYYSQDLKLLNG